jgi:hypothetical protein
MKLANNADLPVVWELLNSHASRWRELHIESNCIEGLSQCFKIFQSVEVPLLQYLEIQFKTKYVRDTRIPRKIFGAGAPSLATVHLNGVTLECCQVPLAATKSLLIYNPIFGMFWGDFYSILGKASNLTNLVITAPVVVIGGRAFGTTIELPSLRSLTVSGNGYGTSEVLLVLLAPNLDSITMKHVWSFELEPFFQILHDGSLPKFPSLRSMTICEVHDFTLSTWERFMDAFPTITHFTFLSHDVFHFLQSLRETCRGPSAVRWLDLHTLRLHEYNHCEYTGLADLLRTVLVRITIGHPIQDLWLSRNAIGRLIRLCLLAILRTHATIQEFVWCPDAMFELLTWRSGIQR